MKKNTTVIIATCLVSVVAMAAMSKNKVRTQTFCKDERLYMDGGYYASVDKGGISPHTFVTLYQRHNGKKVKLSTTEVTEKNQVFSGTNIKLSISGIKPGKQEWSGKIEAKVGQEKISANLLCSPRNS